jgi:hypothetical protein
MSCAVPTAKDVSDFFGSLIGREVSVDEAGPIALSEEGLTATAIYTVEEGSVAAICVCDLHLALNAGAAFSLVAAEEVAAKLGEGKVSREVYETVTEMFRMMANLFSGEGAPEVSFHIMGVTPSPAPGFMSEVVDNANLRLDLDVEIPEYGGGRLSFLAA